MNFMGLQKDALICVFFSHENGFQNLTREYALFCFDTFNLLLL